MGLEEYSIIKQCVAGYTESYAILVERYQKMVYNIAYRMLGDEDTAKDIAQESFISAFSGLRHFHNGSKFSTWLYSIVMNKCRDYLKSRKTHIPIEEIPEVVDHNRANPEEALREKQTMEEIQAALDAMPQDYREAIVLKHIEGLDYKEMEAILGVKANVLKVRTHRAREMLKNLLKEKGIINE